MMTILEFMDKLGVSYREPCTAWLDFYRWRRAMPPEQRPQVVQGNDGRKFVLVDNSGAGD